MKNYIFILHKLRFNVSNQSDSCFNFSIMIAINI